MAYCCYQCGKQIKRGQVQLVVPPRILVELCGDFTKAYHPKCYEKAESEAAKELQAR